MQQLEQCEEAAQARGERRRREQERVPRLAHQGPDLRVQLALAQPVRLVEDDEVGLAGERVLAQHRVSRQPLERHHRVAVRDERIELRAELARGVAEALVVEQREHLVELAVELAEPLHRERLGRHHDRARRAAGAHQRREDQARLDRLAEPYLVRQEPAHRVGAHRLQRGVELMREELDAAAEKAAEAARLAQLREPHPVDAVAERLERADAPGDERVERRGRAGERPELARFDHPAVGEPEAVVLERGDMHLLAARDEPGGASRLERHALQARRRGERERAIGVGKEDLEEAPVDRAHLTDAELRVVGVEEPVADGPAARLHADENLVAEPTLRGRGRANGAGARP